MNFLQACDQAEGKATVADLLNATTATLNQVREMQQQQLVLFTFATTFNLNSENNHPFPSMDLVIKYYCRDMIIHGLYDRPNCPGAKD